MPEDRAITKMESFLKTFRMPATLLVVGIFCALASVPTEAAVSGKISGVVEDAKSNQPLVGASVKIAGTNLVMETDEDGEYFFLNVPIGKYDVVVSYVGFASFTKKEVRVLVDLTTPVDFTLFGVAVDLNREMIVYASEPIIQRDLTSSRVIYTADRLKNLPNIVTIQSVLSNYSGVVVDRNNDLHIRGGRTGQINYYFDGFSVQDPFISDIGIRVIPATLEELSLTSGGFGAEYGDAQSGIVNAVTREGASIYKGSLRAYEGATHPYDVTTAKWGGLHRIGNRSTSFDLSGPIPGMDNHRYTFFSAGEYLRDVGYLPHEWNIGYTGTLKLAMQPTSRTKIRGHLTYSTSDGGVYTHRDVNGASFDFNLDGLPLFEKRGYLAGLSSNFFINSATIWSLSASLFSTRTLTSPGHLLGQHWSLWPGYSENANGLYNGTLHDRNYINQLNFTDPQEAVGFANGDRFDPTYSFRQANYNALNTSLVRQISTTNQVKTGLDYRRYNVTRDFRQFYNAKPYAEMYTSRPVYASWFLEDKLEYADFVMNLGLRYDYHNTDISYNITPGSTPTYKKASPKSDISPRLGVSFPISDKSVMHFNYGLYYQMPQYRHLYFNLEGDLTGGLPLLGNPDLKPERTTSYELGLNHILAPGLKVDLAAYYKDITDLVTTRTVYKGAGGAGTKSTGFLNSDYGTVTGLDISLERLPGNSHFSGSISYGYMNAKGSGSNALDPYYSFLTSSTDTLPPLTEYALDFDQRHTLSVFGDYRVPANWDASLFGLKLPGAWGINMIGRYGSGQPYTKTDSRGERLGERNEGRMPAVINVDMRFNKDFAFGYASDVLTFFIEVDNLFNRKNVINVYTRSGLATDDNIAPGSSVSLSEEDVDSANKLYDHDPQNFSAPRTIRSGFQWSF